MKKKKIILWESLPNIAGGQRVALNIAARLKERFDLEFIVPSKGALSDSLEQQKIKVHYLEPGTYQLGKKGIGDVLKFLRHTPAALWKSYKIIKDADLLYVNSTRLFPWSAVIGNVAGVPVVWHLHNVLVDRKARFLVELFGKMKSVKRIIAVSEAAKNQYSRLRDQIEAVYNGVDITRFNVSLPANGLSDKRHFEKKIGIIGDLIPNKGHDTLFKAVSLVKSKTAVKLLVVGSPQEHLRSHAERLKELAERLGLKEDIVFLGQRWDIPEILNSLDLVVISSSVAFEACPMVALEAFACGVPVVGSDLGGTPELIEDGRTGFVFRAKDEKDLAEKILLILNNPALHDEMRKNCRRAAEERFDLRCSSDKIERIILNSLNKHGKYET
ncbi:MAG: glycosyltransferase family 4 protein [Nitrospirae bacterium]|nr:glycosyltransferase family 4 protein [Nitrospirota bacterium]